MKSGIALTKVPTGYRGEIMPAAPDLPVLVLKAATPDFATQAIAMALFAGWHRKQSRQA